MGHLNEWNEETQGIIHLMVTSICDRDCPLCCNKQYDLTTEVPQVTDEELRKAHTIYLTGGEPFAFANPNAIARHLKYRYSNIKAIRVYTGARELSDWLIDHDEWALASVRTLDDIDGVTVSLKNPSDVVCFDRVIRCDSRILEMSSNMLYVFGDLAPRELGNFIVKPRVWMEDFIPDKKSIFRRI